MVKRLGCGMKGWLRSQSPSPYYSQSQSDLPWFQCSPCNHPYKQHPIRYYLIFNPSNRYPYRKKNVSGVRAAN